ncbi:MAG: 5,10-methylenetetrahydrofolate reductase [Desulfobacterales bacterium]|nr:5,10-methylenetetrahydrofolate reductase [Desulfobacterales bacterium]
MSFQKRLSAGEFVVLAEMNTPKGVNISRFVIDARRVKARVDAIVIPDMDNGIMRMSALAGGVLAQQQGIEAIIHLYCRDRNRMALQGDILAAHVLGVQNLIVVHGEEMKNGDHRDAMPVYDLDEAGLIRAIQSLQEGKDMGGFELDGCPGFVTGCAIAPFEDDKALEAELTAAREKIDAGARFVIFPPIFDLDRLKEFLDKARFLDTPIIPTVFLLKSVAIARYIANSEPGAHISEELIRRIRKSSDRENEGLRIAGETAAALKDLAQGVLIQTLGWEHRLPTILDVAGL